MAATPSPRRFDDRNIRWQALDDFEHLEVTLLDVDEANKAGCLMLPPVRTYADERTEKEGERWTF